jgi:nicotinate-nucleotide adenylyltransferase
MAARIGIFGGTFDPPHIGHLVLAAESHNQLNLDRLLWVLTPQPPHKLDLQLSPLEQRLEMLKLAIADDPGFEVSDVEVSRPGPHYALETVNILKEQNPGCELVYLMGGDSLGELASWRRVDELVRALHWIAVMHRPNEGLNLDRLEKSIKGVKHKILFVNGPRLEISSSDIQKRIASGRPCRYFLLPPVYKYIQEHGLYQQGNTQA